MEATTMLLHIFKNLMKLWWKCAAIVAPLNLLMLPYAYPAPIGRGVPVAPPLVTDQLGRKNRDLKYATVFGVPLLIS